MAQATIATTVTGLQGHPVSNVAPATVGQLLTWNGTAWAPDNTTYMPVAGGTFTGPVTLAGAATEANQPVTLTQAATAIGANVGRNFIHNPQFNINQRGSASYASPATGSGTYTLDRWAQYAGSGDASTVTVAAASAADRAAIGDETVSQYPSIAITGGTGAANSIQFFQRVENVLRLSNKQVTLSFWAYSPTSLRMGIAYLQSFGSGGSPSANFTANFGVVQLTTGWARYTVTGTVASVASQTLGTAANTSFTQWVFWLSCPPANTEGYPQSGNLGAQTGTINIWGVQLEVGSQATPFEHRDPEPEWALCQRFYTILQNFLWMNNVGAGALFYGSISWPTIMRVAPTLTFSGTPNYANASGASVNSINTTLLVMQATATAQGSAWAVINAIASADL